MGEYFNAPEGTDAVRARFRMADHHGLRCDSRGRKCVRLAEVEYTLRPVLEDGTLGEEVTRKCCPRHQREFRDNPNWEWISTRKFVRLDNGRLVNPGFDRGSECIDNGCTAKDCRDKQRKDNAA